MQIIHHMTMDMSRHLPVAPVDAVQGDGNTRKILLTLLEDGKTWNVPEGVTAAVAFRKADGKKGLYDALPDGTKAVTVTGNTVTAILAPQVLTCPGEVSAAVVFHNSALDQLATFPFAIRVKANPAAGQETSNDYYRYSTMEQVSEVVEAALASLEAEKQEFLSKAEEALQVVHDTAAEDAPAIVCEAAGESVTVTDAAEKPLKGLSIYGKTIQNGTPTQENPVPLESVGAGGAINTTVCGKNIAYNIFVGTSTNQYHGILQCAVDGLEPSTNYVISFVGTAGHKIYANESLFNYVEVTCTGYRQSLALKTSTSISKENISQYENGRWIIFKNNESGKTPNFKDVQIERGTIATEFEPYKEAQTLTVSTPNGLCGIPVSSGGNYTDENGQAWICDEIDFARGVYVQRVYAKQMLSTDGYGAQDVFGVFWNVPFPMKAHNVLCNRATFTSVWDFSGGITGVSGVSRIIFGMDYFGVSSVDEFRTYVGNNPTFIMYALATPIETPLSAQELAAYAALHSNKPNTTVFNDANASMKLDYVADTKTYIDNKFAAISEAMLNA